MASFLAINPEEIEDFDECFLNLANKLLTEYLLVISGEEFYLADIEFYLNHSAHPDVFAHSDELQKTHSEWYFHRTGKGYRGGNYKGLDITFAETGYGGILIRAIKAVVGKEYVDGPSKVVDKILSLTNMEKVSQLVNHESFSGRVFESGSLYLKSTTKRRAEIYACPRVGLRLRNTKQVPYVVKPYRFVCFPYCMKKGKQNLVLELYYRGHEFDYIHMVADCAINQCEKWVAGYNYGFLHPSNAEEWFNRNLNVEEFSEFYGVMKRLTDC